MNGASEKETNTRSYFAAPTDFSQRSNMTFQGWKDPFPKLLNFRKTTLENGRSCVRPSIIQRQSPSAAHRKDQNNLANSLHACRLAANPRGRRPLWINEIASGISDLKLESVVTCKQSLLHEELLLGNSLLFILFSSTALLFSGLQFCIVVRAPKRR